MSFYSFTRLPRQSPICLISGTPSHTCGDISEKTPIMAFYYLCAVAIMAYLVYLVATSQEQALTATLVAGWSCVCVFLTDIFLYKIKTSSTSDKNRQTNTDKGTVFSAEPNLHFSFLLEKEELAVFKLQTSVFSRKRWGTKISMK